MSPFVPSSKPQIEGVDFVMHNGKRFNRVDDISDRAFGIELLSFIAWIGGLAWTMSRFIGQENGGYWIFGYIFGPLLVVALCAIISGDRK